MRHNIELLAPGVNVLLDAQWGSTGKGKLGGYLGNRNQIDLCCSSFGPNAGHTYVSDEGEEKMLRFLPSSSLTSGSPALVMPDSVIEVADLIREAAMVKSGVVFVHPRTAVLLPEDAESAKITGHHLAGTMKGTGHAIARKMLRIKGTRLAKDFLPADMIADTCAMVRSAVRAGKTVLFEMSQGFDLSLNHGTDYPYLTSRDVTVGAAINSCGVSHRDVSRVIGSMRSFPIRVGNIDGGWSGPCHRDQMEMSWEDVTKHGASPKPLCELTTVTKRVRRVFSFSSIQMRKFVEHNRPDWLFLNFAQYLDHAATGIGRWGSLPRAVQNFVDTVEQDLRVPVRLIGTGPKDGEMVNHEGA